MFCKSDSVPKPTVRWRKDGKILDPSTDARYEIVLPDYDLKFTTSEETAGKYRCILNNGEEEHEIGWDLVLKVGCKYLKFDEVRYIFKV